ncbi:MAG: hypothetical protein GX928_07065 [Ruminococcaceae bacterium]|nr:hypothetical protein [Oscillospiraceae bacterium]
MTQAFHLIATGMMASGLEIEVLFSEKKRVEHYNELANDFTNLKIETASGLIFYVRAYPTYGWLEWNLSCFQLMIQW